MDRTREALREMADREPELAARVVLMTLPAAAAKIEQQLVHDLSVAGVGDFRVTTGDQARVERLNGERPVDEVDFRLITDAAGLAAMAAGDSPARLMLAGRMRIRGKRRRALKLRAMGRGPEPTLDQALAAGAELMERPWFEVFDDGLREIANRIRATPDDLDLFVEGIRTYHLVIEGVLAMTGQRFILKYMEDHDMYPGFQKGFSLVEQDEHRHIAFGVRLLKDMVDNDRARFGPVIERRMAVLGLEVPPAETIMPGPIASPEEARAAGAPV